MIESQAKLFLNKEVLVVKEDNTKEYGVLTNTYKGYGLVVTALKKEIISSIKNIYPRK